MSFSALCRAVYVRRAPFGSQGKFVRALFEGAGSHYNPDDAYGKKLFSGEKPLSRDILDSFPQPFPTRRVTEFLQEYLTKTSSGPEGLKVRCTTVAAKAGLPTNLNIDPSAFVPALADWFQATILHPGDSDILAIAYQRRLKGDDTPDSTSFTPLYAGDQVAVTKPPTRQSHSAPFWGAFTHEWSLQNRGNAEWSGRSLICTNPKDNGVRPDVDRISIPDTAPREFAKMDCRFGARGREGQATSQWQMVDSEGNNCFPNHSSIFDVKADIVNSRPPKSKAK